MRFTPLSRAREALAERELDVRGWEVRTDLDDEKIGKVEDMLLDDAGHPRYLDVDRGLLKKHILLPVGQARADGRRDIVWVPGLKQDRLDAVPDWDGDVSHLDSRYERRLTAAYRGERLHDEDEAEREPVGAGVGSSRLAELDDLDDYRIPRDEPNPKGWAVVTADGRKVGEVEGLIVDTGAMKVRYLDCDLDNDKLGFSSSRERHVLLPVSNTRLDTHEEHVLLDGITADRLQDLPVYGGLPIGRDFEERLQEHFRQSDEDVRREHERFLAERRAQQSLPRVREGTDEQRLAEDADVAARSRSERLRADADTRRDQADTEPAGTRMSPDEEVRIRVRGDEIIVEKRPRE